MSSNEVSLQARIYASVGASAIAAVVTNPLEVLKSRLQAQLPQSATLGAATESSTPNVISSGARNGGCQALSAGTCTVPMPTARPGPSSLDILKTMIHKEGVGALYRGLPPTLLAAVPTVAIYLPMYDILRDQHFSHLGAFAPLAAGTISRSCSVLVVAPLELVRTRAMSMSAADLARGALTKTALGLPEGGGSGGHAVERHDGVLSRMWRASSLWRGVNATLLRDVPFTAIFWSLTEPMRQVFLPTVTPQTSPSEIVAANASAAGVAGAIAAAITTPFDVIKTQQQISGSSRGVWETGYRIYGGGGWGALFRGGTLRSVRAVPACALVVSSYEVLKYYMSQGYSQSPETRRPACGRREEWCVLQLWCSD